MPSLEQIEQALTHPGQFLAVISDITVFREVADQSAYQTRLFDTLLHHPSHLLGLVKNNSDLQDLAKRYPTQKKAMYDALLATPALLMQLVKNPQDLQLLVHGFKQLFTGVELQEFIQQLMQQLTQDEDFFLSVHHSLAVDQSNTISRYDDQTLINGTMVFFPEYKLPLWEAEVAYIIPILYRKFNEAYDLRYLKVAEQIMEDLVAANTFNVTVYHHFRAHAESCSVPVEGELKDKLRSHFNFIDERYAEQLEQVYALLPQANDATPFLRAFETAITELRECSRFNAKMFGFFRTLAQTYMQGVEGDNKVALFAHLQFIERHQPLPSAAQLTTSMQRGLYAAPDAGVPSVTPSSSSPVVPTTPPGIAVK